MQNTGGFFVAVLEKEGSLQPNSAVSSSNGTTNGTKRPASPSVEETREESSSKKARTTEGAETGVSTPVEAATPTVVSEVDDEPKMGGGRPFSEEPYSYLSADDDQLRTCMYVFR